MTNDCRRDGLLVSSSDVSFTLCVVTLGEKQYRLVSLTRHTQLLLLDFMVLDVPGGDSAEGMAIVERANVMKAAGSYGATSEFLAPKPSFFNILYTHPKFGASAYLALQRGA